MTQKDKYRILIADDHPLICQGLEGFLNQQEDLMVCGKAKDPDALFEKSRTLSPDLGIIDLSLGKRGGLDLIKEFNGWCPEIPMLVLSMHDECFYGERALRAGAKGYIMKDSPLEEVLKAIRMVLSGGVYLSPKMSMRVAHGLVGNKNLAPQPLVSQLTDRELGVFERIGKGFGPKDIAKELHLSVKTIETYRSHIKKKLNLNDSKALRAYAIEWMRDHSL